MTYQQQIKDPRWQKKRLEVLEAHNFECQECGGADQELHVHHPFYRRGAMIWEYDAIDLMCLCHVCHKDAHALDERIKKSLSTLSVESKWYIMGILDGKELRHGLRITEGYNPNKCLLKIDNHHHCFGVADFFGITPQDIWESIKDDKVSLAWLEWHRHRRRTAQGLPAIPPVMPEGADGPR